MIIRYKFKYLQLLLVIHVTTEVELHLFGDLRASQYSYQGNLRWLFRDLMIERQERLNASAQNERRNENGNSGQKVS